MSPLSSEPTPSRTLWRIALVYAAVVASAALILGPVLYVRSNDAIQDSQRAIRRSDRATNHTRKLSCSITSLLGKTPLKPLPGQSQADFLRRERGFAAFLAGLERSHSHCGPAVTRRLRHKLRQARRLEPAAPTSPRQRRRQSPSHAAATAAPPAANPAAPSAGATTTSPPTTSPGSSAGSGGEGGSGDGGSAPPAPGPTPAPKPQPPPHNPPPAPPPDCVVNALGICVPNPL